MITSTGPNEGKTTISANIAATLAENGAKVLLIDADLRHPSVAKRLDIDGSAGLAHVLSGQATVRDVVQRYWRPNLHVMPAGPKPPNASRLLNSPLMVELVNNALQQYDYVIIDTAPMVVANDAVLFVRRGGALVMVCRRDQTLKRDLREISEELTTLDMSATGIIINCAKDTKKTSEYGNYYYYYSNDDEKNDEAKGKKKSLLSHKKSNK
ncbi:MAG: CpsD/CapB family tyrosine-protein kinase [Bifidobacterium sp.]|nr:CpsD/CapB family tyrosine-protein kinase [Bifidobacterium sp.]